MENYVDLHIPNDVVRVIMEYFDLWLRLCYKDGVDFIKQKLLSKNKDPNREIYVHEVCAINPKEIDEIMKEVECNLLQQSCFASMAHQ